MHSRLRFWKYPLIVILLFLLTAAFALVYDLADTATAPYQRIEEPVIETPQQDEDEEPEEEEIEEEPEEEEIDPVIALNYNPAEDGFITYNMDASDIYTGYLMLVNQDHEYNIPDNLNLVPIVEAQSITYRVQFDVSQLLQSIIEPLDNMMEAFISTTNNKSVAIISAFRNIETQQRVLNNYIARMGRREALNWAALPGHSEHHTGLAFDFGIMSGNNRSTFTGTGNTSWFRQNSYNYGFILRFPQNKTHITKTSYEPWHFRYVGIPHSIIINKNNWCLEEYIDIIRDYTFEEPLEFEHDGVSYEIYFTTETEIKLPLHCEYTISGNNVDGFIITAVRLEFDPDEVIDVSI